MKRNIILGVSCLVMVVVGTVFMSTAGSSQGRGLDVNAPSASTTLVISQAYGGGGGTGTYLFDYVEIKNISSTNQALNGLTLMYGSATGQFMSSPTNGFALPDATIAPGKYYLVQTSSAGTSGANLPVTPDATTTNMSMSGTNGKVALVTSALVANTCGATATPCTLPQAGIIDLVSWGTANNAEGNSSTNGGASLTSTQGNVRKGNGCTDTDNNNNDFDIVTAPVPRNAATAAITCGSGGATPTPTPAPTATPTPAPTPSPTATPAGSPRFLFTTRLSGANEVPANSSTGTGFGRVVLNAAENQITASVYWEGLGSNTTAGHIHTGAVGVSGGITFDMAPPTGATRGSVVEKTFAITPTQVATLRAGGMYFNIHSTNFSGGEIRGQLLSTTTDAPLDFNGDGKTDFGVVRQAAGAGGTQIRWYNLLNNAAATETQTDFGVVTDYITPGDFDGDGKDDIAIWRPQTDNSFFYILQSSTNTLRTVRFGMPNDDPFLIADYDGDGVDDPAIFRKGGSDSSQSFFWWYGSYGTTKNVQVVVPWGVGADVAAPGDYNGDGKADFCVFRGIGTPARGLFFIHYGTGLFDATSPNDTVTRFGLPTDAIVPGDYDGDGKTDLALTRVEGAALAWYYLPSSGVGGGTTPRLAWGRQATDIEVQGDYDGDGTTDRAIWRSATGTPSVYYILRSSDGSVQYQFWGLFGDQPAAQDSHL